MAGLERDYLMRLTRDLSALAARLLRLNPNTDSEAARAQLKEAAQQHTGLDLETLLRLSEGALAALLDEVSGQAAVAILLHEAEWAEHRGEPQRAVELRGLAHRLDELLRSPAERS